MAIISLIAKRSELFIETLIQKLLQFTENNNDIY